MGSDNGSRRELPERHITLNQVVAWNLAWYRRKAGLTQRELGERIGWTYRQVSEAERSWDGERTREFDAQLLADLASALGVQILALLLPPVDDGLEVRYTYTAHYEDAPPGEEDMTALMTLVMHDSDDDTPVMDAYRQRFRAQLATYRPDWKDDGDKWMSPPDDEAMRAESAAVMRADADYAEQMAARLRKLAAGIDPPAEGQS